jgi:hypothetical protein
MYTSILITDRKPVVGAEEPVMTEALMRDHVEFAKDSEVYWLHNRLTAVHGVKEIVWTE